MASGAADGERAARPRVDAVTLPVEGALTSVSFPAAPKPVDGPQRGLVPGAHLRYTRGPFVGEKHRVIGERSGRLWVLRGGDRTGISCIPAADHRELATVYGAQEVPDTDSTAESPTSFLRKTETELRARQAAPRWAVLEPLAPPLLADPGRALVDFWCGLNVGESHTMEAGPWRGLTMILRGIRSGTAVFDVIGWDLRRLPSRRIPCAKVRAPQPPLVFSVPLGAARQTDDRCHGSDFAAVSTGLRLRPLPAAEQVRLREDESDPEWLWRSVKHCVTGAGDVCAEDSAAAANRLWILTAYRRQW
eukprot:TRINITY_DN36151_c0_g1_i1.p1 TRINITY_DN36151_c0_g1~~TRINITY_DN36151_c0_g1_i1.p1  ORF type:complete len:320 (+),score=69.78 TRINITY_DN36151_c0_g1_i1:46-960(+)